MKGSAGELGGIVGEEYLKLAQIRFDSPAISS